MIDGLMALPKNGRVTFVCSKCGSIPENAYGAQNRDQLVYMLVCSNLKCNRVLGEWVTAAERDEELRAFAKRVAT